MPFDAIVHLATARSAILKEEGINHKGTKAQSKSAEARRQKPEGRSQKAERINHKGTKQERRSQKAEARSNKMNGFEQLGMW